MRPLRAAVIADAFFKPFQRRIIFGERFKSFLGQKTLKAVMGKRSGVFIMRKDKRFETGFINKSIQIAGTAEPTQLPFFVVSCDYTISGEELFAVSAYLSKDPRLVSSLRASDIIKVVVIVSVIVGTILSSFGYGEFAAFWKPGGN